MFISVSELVFGVPRVLSQLPMHKLSRQIRAGRVPMVLVSCGSFNPPTLLHTRIMEEAKDAVQEEGKYEVTARCHIVFRTSVFFAPCPDIVCRASGDWGLPGSCPRCLRRPQKEPGASATQTEDGGASDCFFRLAHARPMGV